MRLDLVPSSLAMLARRWRQRAVAEVCRRTFQDAGGLATPTAMLVGTARSGTTWLAELIDSQVPCRVMFEPFNPEQVPEFAPFEHFQYMRPDVDHPALLSFCDRVVRGEIRGRWIDGHATCVFPRFRLVKDIRATLMLRWFHLRFPGVPLLYLLRHPCAVVLSRMRLGWATDLDVQRFLRQPLLVSDHLQPYLPVIERATTDEEKHAVIWCISNLVPLRQFEQSGCTWVRYEQLREHQAVALRQVFDAIGVTYGPDVHAALARPSRTTRQAASFRDQRLVEAWRSELTTRQIDSILDVVSEFGLDHLYA